MFSPWYYQYSSAELHLWCFNFFHSFVFKIFNIHWHKYGKVLRTEKKESLVVRSYQGRKETFKSGISKYKCTEDSVKNQWSIYVMRRSLILKSIFLDAEKEIPVSIKI